VRQVGYLRELYEDARSEKYKKIWRNLYVVPYTYLPCTYLQICMYVRRWYNIEPEDGSTISFRNIVLGKPQTRDSGRMNKVLLKY
jgi:hypothetical protein